MDIFTQVGSLLKKIGNYLSPPKKIDRLLPFNHKVFNPIFQASSLDLPINAKPYNKTPTKVLVAVILCDYKKYSQIMAIPACTKFTHPTHLYVNIETEYDKPKFEQEYFRLLSFLKNCSTPYDLDVWRWYSKWQAPRKFDQDNHYRLTRIITARNMAVERLMLSPEFSHILFIDSDVVPSPKGLTELLAMKKWMCGGTVPDRLHNPNCKYIFHPISTKDNITECHFGTCGYMLIAREVFDFLRFRWGRDKRNFDAMLSEDPALCLDAYYEGFGRFFINRHVRAQHRSKPSKYSRH